MWALTVVIHKKTGYILKEAIYAKGTAMPTYLHRKKSIRTYGEFICRTYLC
jgi:hypothetical protein